MRGLINSCIIAFAMYSKIPMPRADWNEKNMKYVFCFFPLVGAVIGAIVYGIWNLSGLLSFGTSFRAVCLVAVPLVITGGIHLDGYLDTADAMSSWQERERRLEILKDSHAGAFAIIAGGFYFLFYFGIFSQMGGDALPVVAAAFVLSRALSGISVMHFPKAKKTGTVSEFSKKAENRKVTVVLVLYALAAAALMLYLNWISGIAALAAAGLIFIWYYHMAMKYFGGINGDLAGCFLTVAEVGMALAAVLAETIVRYLA